MAAGDSARMFRRLAATPDDIAAFCRRWRLAELSLFGSVLRDDFSRESDIDVLVAFEPGCAPGFGFVRMANELSELFGRPVDVLTRSAVERSANHLRRKAILESVEVVHATAR